ncbi:hypothetical protein HDU93_004375 [Gonapodya sp. JEL0774]|nr:hypothetical protein HDU93_004375 [Gonapodya sp. JEL0774]
MDELVAYTMYLIGNPGLGCSKFEQITPNVLYKRLKALHIATTTRNITRTSEPLVKFGNLKKQLLNYLTYWEKRNRASLLTRLEMVKEKRRFYYALVLSDSVTDDD